MTGGKTASFPKPERRNGRRRIVSSPYESDSDVSFVRPFGDKKASVRYPTILDKIAVNATEIQSFGRQLTLSANEAIQSFSFVSFDVDSSDGEDSHDSWRRVRVQNNAKLLRKAMRKASTCGASLRDVATTLPDACMDACMLTGDDECSSSSDGRSYGRRRVGRKKRASEAKPCDGSLSDEISISTDDDYSSIASDGSTSDAANSAKSEVTSGTATNFRREKLRRRRQQFLRRLALERAAGAETDEEEDTTMDAVGPKPRVRTGTSHFPTQELRWSTDLMALGAPSAESFSGGIEAPHLVNTSIESVLNTTYEDDRKDSFPEAHYQRRPSNRTSTKHLSSASKRMQWQRIEKVLDDFVPSPYNFLENTHVGLSVVRAPCGSVSEVVQLGDAIIRLNGSDVRGWDRDAVFKMMNNMAGDTVRITCLRKKMKL